MIHSSEPEESSILQLSTCELRGKGVVGEEAGVQVAQRRPRRDPVYGVPEIIDACLSALILSTTATFFLRKSQQQQQPLYTRTSCENVPRTTQRRSSSQATGRSS
jgi:hypothetical protein